MKDRNLINSLCERTKSITKGRNKKIAQRVTYGAACVLVLAFIASSYLSADSSTQISLPGAVSGNDIDVNLLQGQKIEQVNQANAMAASISSSTGGNLAAGSSTATPAVTATTADEVKAANIASTVASVVNLSSSNSVSSGAESANISAELAQADATSVSKQQIIEPSAEVKALTQYVVKDGDTAETVANEYGVSAQTIRWANNLKDNNMAVGATITIPAVDGVVYTMKDGDTLESVAAKYQSNVDEIININNLESESVPVGATILLPDGVLPETERPEYVAPTPVRQVSSTTTTTRSELLTWLLARAVYGLASGLA